MESVASIDRVPALSTPPLALSRGIRQSGAIPDPAACSRALRSRDPRFDGRFFAAVSTTRVYCRSICPVPLRKPENIRWFANAADAEAAGFRPCKRCNSHLSPGTPAWFGTAAVVSRALKLILDGGLDATNVEALAERVGIGPRHLRRLFRQHLGASPLSIAQTRRVHVARALLDETDLSVTEVAFRSGFRSIRQFNQVMHAAFDRSPSELRRSNLPTTESGIVIYLSYRAPLDWPALIAFLKLRALPGVEAVEDDFYRRTIMMDGEVGEIEVSRDHRKPRLRVQVKLKSYTHLLTIAYKVRHLFDLFANPLQISAHLSNDPSLRNILRAHPGLRAPGAWSGFEV